MMYIPWPGSPSWKMTCPRRKPTGCSCFGNAATAPGSTPRKIAARARISSSALPRAREATRSQSRWLHRHGRGAQCGQGAPDAARGIPPRSATSGLMVIRILRSLGSHLLHQSFGYDDALVTMTLPQAVVAPANAPNPLIARLYLCYRLASNTVILNAAE